MSFRGDRTVASTVGGSFRTSVNKVGTTLSGSPVLSVYKRGSSTPSTSGVAVNVDVNSLTGFNTWTVDTSQSAAFYVFGGDFDVVITTGTINGVNVAGEVVGCFTLAACAGIVRAAIAQAGAAGSVTLDSGASATDNIYNGLIVMITSGTGAGQARLVTGYTGASKVATTGPNWTTNPDSTSVFFLADWAGGTAIQTGDSYGRLGAPAGASVSADIAAIKAELPQRVTKNTALAKFMFFMVSSTDHVTGKTGLTVTATRAIDGGAFGACANSATEIANGWYYLDLANTDLNGNVIAFNFTGTGADVRAITVITQPA